MVVYLRLLVPPLGLPVATYSFFNSLNMAGTSYSSVAVMTGFLSIAAVWGSFNVAASMRSQQSQITIYGDPPILFNRQVPVGTALLSILSCHRWDMPPWLAPSAHIIMIYSTMVLVLYLELGFELTDGEAHL